MELVLKELGRLIKPFPVSELLSCLQGGASVFDVDGIWHSHHHGSPRPARSEPRAFDEVAFRAGVRAIAFLSLYLPVGDPIRGQLTALDEKILERLRNPDLLLYGGFEDMPSELPDAEPYVARGYEAHDHHHGHQNDALVSAHGYLYLRPHALRRAADIAICRAASSGGGYFETLEAYRSPPFRALVARIGETPVPAGRSEADPRASNPELVARVVRRFEIEEDAASVYLQILSLPDCGDPWLRTINGTTAATHRTLVGMLVDADLLELRKEPRAGRKAVLPGPWEKLAPPDPGVEQWKLPLFGASTESKLARSPLERLLPLRPAHTHFEAAWNRVETGCGPGSLRAPTADDSAWVCAIADARHDDEPRLVYADHLTTMGDPRGELITLQTQRVRLAREGGGAALAEVIEHENALLRRWRAGWTERVHPYVEDCGFDRGFITWIRIRAPVFVDQAPLLFDALPLLEELVLHDREGANPIPTSHVRKLAGCPHFERIRRLDFTADQYLSTADDLQLLLEAEHLPRLEWLRIGFHRRGEGVGPRGAEQLAECPRLGNLRFLELSGQNLGIRGARALLDSAVLNALEVLRLPLNDLDSEGVRDLLARLEAGALPSLRVLDVGNFVETTFVTKAAEHYRNKVARAVQSELQRVLAARDGSAEAYTYDLDSRR